MQIAQLCLFAFTHGRNSQFLNQVLLVPGLYCDDPPILPLPPNEFDPPTALWPNPKDLPPV